MDKINEELESFKENKIWILIASNVNIIQIVGFSKEHIKYRTICKYKIKLVIRGYASKNEINYKKIFFPVVKYRDIIRLSIVAVIDLKLIQFDIKMVFRKNYLHDVTGFELNDYVCLF